MNAKNALIAAAVVYGIGVVVVRWKLDTSPDSDYSLTLGWPVFAAKNPKDFLTSLKWAFTKKAVPWEGPIQD